MSPESLDSYGTVSAGEPTSVWLPAGTVSISLQSNGGLHRGMHGDLPTIVSGDGERVPVTLLFGGPSAGRFATADIPADGEYVIRARGSDLLIGSAEL
jgi:hypothetical protein